MQHVELAVRWRSGQFAGCTEAEIRAWREELSRSVKARWFLLLERIGNGDFDEERDLEKEFAAKVLLSIAKEAVERLEGVGVTVG